MPRRGRSTTIGKLGKVHQDRRVSEIRVFGELLRRERDARPGEVSSPSGVLEAAEAR